ncbi:MAG: alginate export family protein [Pseudomonadota bacterium]
MVQLAAAGFISLAPVSTLATEATSLTEALQEGDAQLSFRYRLETVDQTGLAKDAVASTLRTRLLFQTAKWQGWDGLLEVDNVSYLGNDNFNNTRNGQTNYPVVADPKGTDVNQALLGFQGEHGSVRLGRQRLNLDNQRFIGGVGWRQNEQTYDAASFTWTIRQEIRLEYCYINRVSRVFGPENGTPDKTLDANSHLVTGRVQLGSGTLSGYGFLLDFDNAAALSSQTIGAAYTNRFGDQRLAFPVRLEYAHQVDAGNSPVDYGASYLHTSIGVETRGLSASLGFEKLGADSGAMQAFATPLATLHKFNGWADKFLSTPAAGLRDQYVSFGAPVGSGRMDLTLHTFDADAGGTDYGRELDISYSATIASRVNLLVKAARYQTKGFASDTTKVWLMLTTAF